MENLKQWWPGMRGIFFILLGVLSLYIMVSRQVRITRFIQHGEIVSGRTDFNGNVDYSPFSDTQAMYSRGGPNFFTAEGVGGKEPKTYILLTNSGSFVNTWAQRKKVTEAYINTADSREENFAIANTFWGKWGQLTLLLPGSIVVLLIALLGVPALSDRVLKKK